MSKRSTADGLGVFLNSAGKVALLTPAEELHLGQRVQALMALLEANPEGPYSPEERRAIKAGRRAKDRMVTANLRLVVTVARRFSQRGERVGLSIDDLVQEGCIGLGRGVEKFDPTRGYKFSTYAYWWIRQAITRALNTSGAIRLPIHVADTLSRIAGARRAFEAEGIHRPSFEQLQQRTGVAVNLLKAALEHGQSAREVSSLDRAMTPDGGTLADVVAAEGDDPLHRTDLWDAVQGLREWLPDETALLELRAVEGARLADLGDVMGVSRTRAGQALTEARSRLRAVAGEHALELLAC